MSNRVWGSVFLLASVFCTGCSTIKSWSNSVQEWHAANQVKRRNQIAQEFKRLASLPPAQLIVSPDPEIADCAKLSCALFNDAQVKMKAYVDFTETAREYTGFINDVQYYIKEEKLSSQDACKKVVDAVIAADAARSESEKLWPRIKRGCVAARALGPQNQLALISGLHERWFEIHKRLGKIDKLLDKRYKELKLARKSHQIDDQALIEGKNLIKNRRAECMAINGQLNEASNYMSLISDQYNRVVELENYTK